MRYCRVVYNAVKPRREFTLVPERVQVAVYLYETLLHNVFRILYVATDPVGDGERHVLVGFDKVRERGSFARKHLLYTLILVHRGKLFLFGFFSWLGYRHFLRHEEIGQVSQTEEEDNACSNDPEFIIMIASQVFRT